MSHSVSSPAGWSFRPALACARSVRTALPPFMKSEKRRAAQEQERDAVIPFELLAEIRHREYREHAERDNFLHGLELRRRIDAMADAVRRNRQAIFEKGDAPADR